MTWCEDLLAVKLHAPELKVSSSISDMAEYDSPFSIFNFFEGDDMAEECPFFGVTSADFNQHRMRPTHDEDLARQLVCCDARGRGALTEIDRRAAGRKRPTRSTTHGHPRLCPVLKCSDRPVGASRDSPWRHAKECQGLPAVGPERFDHYQLNK